MMRRYEYYRNNDCDYDDYDYDNYEYKRMVFGSNCYYNDYCEALELEEAERNYLDEIAELHMIEQQLLELGL